MSAPENGDANIDPPQVGTSTEGPEYTARLARLEQAKWKRLINAQAPYRWNIRRLHPGFTLDVGCGLGRNLAHLDGQGIGVDHNPDSIATVRAKGFIGFTVEEFFQSEYAKPGTFDSILVAHVVEHMVESDALAIVGSYLPFLKPGGKVIFITPQERGYATDATHVRFVGFPEQSELAKELNLTIQRQFSFPFPRAVGKIFPYNEFVCVSTIAG